MSESANTALVRSFIDSFNAQDLDAFVATLHPEVEIVGGRGLRIGTEDARSWATFKPGGVQQRIVIDKLRESGDVVLAFTRRQWYWDGTDELANEDEMAHMFTLRDGLVARWQPFEDRDEALRVLGDA